MQQQAKEEAGFGTVGRIGTRDSALESLLHLFDTYIFNFFIHPIVDLTSVFDSDEEKPKPTEKEKKVSSLDT
jgi:hypothetical protein